MTVTTRSSWLRAPPEADSVLAAKGRSFYWAKHLLDPVHAARATRLYRLCRYIDDLADETSSVDAARKALSSAALSIKYGDSADLLVSDGLKLMRECQIDPAIVLELIKGVSSDLDEVLIPDVDSLLRYCFQVAGTVGLMMCKVLDTEDPAAFPHAIDLGIAMQLTNICRDISADAALGRRYLPASMVGKLAPDELIDPAPLLRPLLRQCVAALLDRADIYYRSGEAGLSYLPVRARGGILVAARIYRAIGTELRARDNAFWTGRVVVRKRVKAVLTARALLDLSFRPAFWRHPLHHDNSLHSALSGLLLSNSPSRPDHAA
jgi:phytoene synthase